MAVLEQRRSSTTSKKSHEDFAALCEVLVARTGHHILVASDRMVQSDIRDVIEFIYADRRRRRPTAPSASSPSEAGSGTAPPVAPAAIAVFAVFSQA